VYIRKLWSNRRQSPDCWMVVNFWQHSLLMWMRFHILLLFIRRHFCARRNVKKKERDVIYWRSLRAAKLRIKRIHRKLSNGLTAFPFLSILFSLFSTLASSPVLNLVSLEISYGKFRKLLERFSSGRQIGESRLLLKVKFALSKISYILFSKFFVAKLSLEIPRVLISWNRVVFSRII